MFNHFLWVAQLEAVPKAVKHISVKKNYQGAYSFRAGTSGQSLATLSYSVRGQILCPFPLASVCL